MPQWQNLEKWIYNGNIKCHDILHYQRRLVISSEVTHTQWFNIHLFAHLLGTCPLISGSAMFSLAQHYEKHPTLLQVISHKRSGGQSEKTLEPAIISAAHSITYTCARALHSILSSPHCCSASTVITLLHKATCTPSIQPILKNIYFHFFNTSDSTRRCRCMVVGTITFSCRHLNRYKTGTQKPTQSKQSQNTNHKNL